MSNHQTKRIEYIDALRGFTMILVVFQHVATFCWGISNKDIPSVHEYFMQIRMPMFFFISGFVLYKKDVDWNFSFVIKFLKKKFLIQIIPTVIFLLLILHILGWSFLDAIMSSSKAGYWFTYTLFEYFIFYAILRFLTRKSSNHLQDIVLIIVALMFYMFKSGMFCEMIPLSNDFKSFLGVGKWYYFCFFVIGTLVRKHFDAVQNWLDGKWLVLFCIVAYFVLNVYRDVFPKEGMFGEMLDFSLGFVLSLTGLVILFAFFRTNQSLFTKDTKLGFSLQYIGRRTLDVYLIHYFLIPYQMPKYVHIFEECPMPVIEATCSLLFALVIIAFCLLISNILRLSPFLAHWLFGVKYKVNDGK
jgi:surface polysaccharide O-acyltransferase-like enzyme